MSGKWGVVGQQWTKEFIRNAFNRGYGQPLATGSSSQTFPSFIFQPVHFKVVTYHTGKKRAGPHTMPEDLISIG